MTSTQLLIGAIVCILTGAILSYLQPGEPIATMLIVAGTAALGGQAVVAKSRAQHAEQEAESERQRADEAISQTQILQRKMLQQSKDKP